MAYRMVYLRVRCNGYDPGASGGTDLSEFKTESRRLFREMGWMVHEGRDGISDTVTKDRQDLYLYTDDSYTQIKEGSSRYIRQDSSFMRQGNKRQVATNFWNVDPGTMLYIGIRTKVRKGGPLGEAVYSDWVNFTYTNSEDDGGVPWNLRAESTGVDTATLLWQASSPVEVCQFTDATYTEQVKGSRKTLDASRKELTGLKAGTTYYFGVRQAAGPDAKEYSDWTYLSYTHTGTTKLTLPQFSTPIAPLRMVPSGKDEALLTWSTIYSDPLDHELCEYTDSTFTEIKKDSIRTYPNDGEKYRFITGLEQGKTYYFGLRCKDYPIWSQFTYTHK